MPKIGKDLFHIKSKSIEVEIWYDRKRGFVYKGIPQEVYDLTDFGSRPYESEKELRTALLCMLTVYHEKITKQRKVILYRLYGSTELLMNKMEGENRGYTGTKSGVSKQFSTPDGGLGIQYLFGFRYDVLIEVSGKTIEYHYPREDGETPGSLYRINPSPKEGVIEWTQEREIFFSDLTAQLQTLIYGVSNFFDQPDLLQLMDTHGIKALGAK